MDGKKVGLWYEYENEKVVFKVSFDEKERLCGLCKEYDLDGKIIAEEIYIKGKLIKRIEKKFCKQLSKKSSNFLMKYTQNIKHKIGDVVFLLFQIINIEIITIPNFPI